MALVVKTCFFLVMCCIIMVKCEELLSARLIQAILGGEQTVDVLHELLAEGADPDLISHDGMSLVIHAAIVQNVDAINELISFGANLNVVEGDGWTPLMFAAAEGNVALAQTIVHGNADPRIANYQEYTAIQIAKANKHQEVVNLLANAGTMYAINIKSTRGLLKALEERSDINLANAEGFTPLLYLCSVEDVHGVREVLGRYGAKSIDVLHQGGPKAFSCMDYAKDRQLSDMVQLLEVAIASSTD